MRYAYYAPRANYDKEFFIIDTTEHNFIAKTQDEESAQKLCKFLNAEKE